MTTTFVREPRKPREIPLFVLQAVLALLAGGLLFLILLVVFSGFYQVLNWGRVFPGVSVAAVDLSGMQPAEAAAKLTQVLTYQSTGRIVLRDGGRVWSATPAELGMLFDQNGTANAAYGLGRRGGLFRGLGDQLNAWQIGIDVAPVMIFDQRQAYDYLQKLSTVVNQPVVEAHLHIDGANVTAEPGQVGRTLDIQGTLVFLSAQLQTFRDGELPLVVIEQKPQVQDVSAQAEQARRLLASPLTITLPDARPGDPGPWQIGADIMGRMLGVEVAPEGGGLHLVLDQNILQPLIEQIAKQVNRNPGNARFTFNDSTRQLDLVQAALDGRTVKVPETLEALNRGLTDQQGFALVLDVKKPQVTSDATAQQLGITELVSAQTSYFRGSTAARMQNIKTASAQFHGLLVAPGEVFSMGNILGDVSLDNGYAEALIIYGGRTITGVGGGVCQVSTTLFRTAFFGGFPIAERYPHAYRVYYYEQGVGGNNPDFAGMDATVYFPLVDFKFVNDTPHWLLMETYFNAASQSLTWKFYSTSDGRSVDWQTTGPQNVVPAPEPNFQLNPELGKKQLKQVDWAADGADVTVTRTVTRGGQVISTDRFFTHYQPWQAVYEYGPGVDNPKKLLKQGSVTH